MLNSRITTTRPIRVIFCYKVGPPTSGLNSYDRHFCFARFCWLSSLMYEIDRYYHTTLDLGCAKESPNMTSLRGGAGAQYHHIPIHGGPPMLPVSGVGQRGRPGDRPARYAMMMWFGFGAWSEERWHSPCLVPLPLPLPLPHASNKTITTWASSRGASARRWN